MKILIALLIATLSYSLSLQKTHQTQKILIQIYGQSICTHFKMFALGPLKNALKSKDFWNIVDLKIYPYGLASRVKRAGQSQIKCYHGPKQCQGNSIIACAINKLDYLTQTLPFMICLQEKTVKGQWQQPAIECAQKYKINADQLTTCIYGKQGRDLIDMYADKTEALKPKINHVPYVFVNGKNNKEDQDHIIHDMLDFVCKKTENSNTLDFCN